MRIAFNKEIVRSISRSRSRFLAILAITALGAGFYAGLRMCAPDMRTTVDRYLDATALMDIHLVSTLGFSDADAAEVARIDGVATVAPSHVADASATVADRRATIRIHGLDVDSIARATRTGDSAFLNRPILVAGRWPDRSGECVIDTSRFYANAAQIGGEVVLTAGVVPLDQTFTRTSFTIVGVVDSSYYMRMTRGTTTLADGNIDRFMFVPEEDFADPKTYTDLFVTVRGASDVSTFEPEYDDIVKPVAERIERLAPAREAARLAEVKSTAQASLDEKRAEYDHARAEADAKLTDGREALEMAAAELDRSARDLDAGWRRYRQGVDALAAERAASDALAAGAQSGIDAGRADLAAQASALERLASALPALQAGVASAESSVVAVQAAYDAAVAAEASGLVVTPSAAELAVTLADAQAQLAAARQTYDTQSATYDAGTTALAAASADLDARQAELAAGIAAGAARFRAAQRDLDAARRRLVAGGTELEAGRAELAEGAARLDSQSADAEAGLAGARESIDEAQTTIDAIERPDWYVLGRGTNVGYANLSADADRIEAISIVFPLIFFLVAALVSLTTMTRMVDEERTLIGVYKALGYGRWRIASKYLVYAGIASIVGSAAGIVVGSQVLPRTVWRAYTTMYTAPPVLTSIDIPLALTAGVSSIAITLLATLAAVGTTLREGPATLMLPRAPKPGKRILLERIRPVWSRLSFSHKVTARNLFRYKKRFLMTVIGIAGCTALLLTGFGLKNSISDVLDKQYGDIYLFDVTVGFEPGAISVDPSGSAARVSGADGDLAALLNDPSSFTDHLVADTRNVWLTNAEDPPASASAGPATTTGTGFGDDSAADQSSIAGYVTVPSAPKRLPNLIRLQNRRSGKPIALDDSGVVITEKAAESLGLRAGDLIRVELLDENGTIDPNTAVTLPVSGISEQYVSHYVYMTPDLFDRSFGQAPEYNVILARVAIRGADAREALSQSLLSHEGVTTVQFSDDITSSFDEMLRSLDSVVLILILSAAMLAFIVLYNLTNINVTERTREIATIKVLGFYDAEVNAYIYRETAVLTVIGCLLGLLLGIGLEAFVITTVEIDIVMFGRTIHAPSYLYSALLTLAFAIVVNLAMAPRLRRIDMVESLKSIE